MNLTAKKRLFLRLFSAAGAVTSAGTLVFNLRASSEIQSAILLGYSGARLAVTFVLILAIAAFLWLAVVTWHGPRADRLVSSLDRQLDKPWLSGGLLIGCFLAFLWGSIILVVAAEPFKYTSYIHPIFTHLAILGGWLALLGGIMLIGLAWWRPTTLPGGLPVLFFVLIILWAAIFVHIPLWDNKPDNDDIYYAYLEGQRLAQGENPYERAQASDMLSNDKYATYLPIFYYLAWITIKLGFSDYVQWIDIYKFIFLSFNASIGLLLFYLPARQKMVGLGILAMLFWLFNRYTLHVTRSVDLDFMPIFFLILSLALLDRWSLLACLFFGLSLGIKHIAIFLTPMYLFWNWQTVRLNLRDLLARAGAIAGLPLLASLPFIVMNWQGFFKSILFSTTRYATASSDIFAVDKVLGWSGSLGRLPLLLLIGLLYLVFYRLRDRRPFLFTLLIIAVFLNFNSTLFTSYHLWLVPFVPLAVFEALAQPASDRIKSGVE